MDEADAALTCRGASCSARYPVVDDVPVLVDDHQSLFQVEEILASKSKLPKTVPGVKRALSRLAPVIGENRRARANYQRLAALLLAASETPRVLVVGGKIEGEGFDVVASDPRIEVISTDILFGPATEIVADAHALPFADASFDGVVCQAVLEHVLDPERCVAEIHRVLTPRGVVYAEVPFIQQVHAGRFDFSRFTHLGLRRLFRRFQEVESGAVCGVGMALAWSWEHFLTTVSGVKRVGQVASRLTAFWLKYVDRGYLEAAGTYDAASAYFFLGKRSESTLSDRELIRLYRGLG